MTGVAIIIAAYKSSATIGSAIRSALAEPETTQIIVVDDASPDDTAVQAHAADDGSGRLQVISMPRNAGPSAARNRALAECRTEWMTILDDDDFFLPGRLKGLLGYAGKADMIADDIWRVDESDIDGPRTLFLGRDLTTPQQISFSQFVESNITDRRRPRGELGFIKPIMRRAFLEQHRLRYQENMRLGEDYELYARALGLGAKLILVPAQGYVSVVRAGSLSGSHTENDLLQLRDCDQKLGAMPGLSANDRAALRDHYLSIDCRLQWRLFISAFKVRDLRGMAAAFLRPWPVPFYLLRQLAEQIVVRSMRKIKA